MSSNRSDAPVVPDGWRAVWDESRSKWYFYNRATKETSWTAPTASVNASAPAPAAPAAAPAPVASPAPAHSSSKPVWRAVQDDKGRTYYYNRVTRETSWVQPSELAPTVVQPAPAAASAAGSGEGGDAALPPGWRAVKDDRGREYYYNKGTRETSWTRPAPAASGAAPPAAAPVVASEKPAWRSVVDPASGRTYWYNRVTKQRTWTQPPEAAASPAPAPAPAPAAPGAAAAEGAEVPPTTRGSSAATAPPAAAGTSQPPRSAWKQVTDARGRVYWYHTRTRETTWTCPDEYKQFEVDMAAWTAAAAAPVPAPAAAAEEPVAAAPPAPTLIDSADGADVAQARGRRGSATRHMLSHTPGTHASPHTGARVQVRRTSVDAKQQREHAEAAAAAAAAATAAEAASADDSATSSSAPVPASTADSVSTPRITAAAPVSFAVASLPAPLPPPPAALPASATAAVSPSATSQASPIISYGGVTSLAAPPPEAPLGGARTTADVLAATAAPPYSQLLSMGRESYTVPVTTVYMPAIAEAPALQTSAVSDVYVPSYTLAVQKRPDFASLMRVHASEVERLADGSETQVDRVAGVLPADVPGGALTPRSASQQLCGYLHKRAHTGMRHWVGRFYVTHRWMLLYYPHADAPAHMPLGVADLRRVTSLRLIHSHAAGGRLNTQAGQDGWTSAWLGGGAPAAGHARPRMIDITFDDDSTQRLLLRAGSHSDALRWHTGLLQLLRRYGCAAGADSPLAMLLARPQGADDDDVTSPGMGEDGSDASNRADTPSKRVARGRGVRATSATSAPDAAALDVSPPAAPRSVTKRTRSAHGQRSTAAAAVWSWIHTRFRDRSRASSAASVTSPATSQRTAVNAMRQSGGAQLATAAQDQGSPHAVSGQHPQVSTTGHAQTRIWMSPGVHSHTQAVAGSVLSRAAAHNVTPTDVHAYAPVRPRAHTHTQESQTEPEEQQSQQPLQMLSGSPLPSNAGTLNSSPTASAAASPIVLSVASSPASSTPQPQHTSDTGAETVARARALTALLDSRISHIRAWTHMYSTQEGDSMVTDPVFPAADGLSATAKAASTPSARPQASSAPGSVSSTATPARVRIDLSSHIPGLIASATSTRAPTDAHTATLVDEALRVASRFSGSQPFPPSGGTLAHARRTTTSRAAAHTHAFARCINTHTRAATAGVRVDVADGAHTSASELVRALRASPTLVVSLAALCGAANMPDYAQFLALSVAHTCVCSPLVFMHMLSLAAVHSRVHGDASAASLTRALCTQLSTWAAVALTHTLAQVQLHDFQSSMARVVDEDSAAVAAVRFMEALSPCTPTEVCATLATLTHVHSHAAACTAACHGVLIPLLHSACARAAVPPAAVARVEQALTRALTGTHTFARVCEAAHSLTHEWTRYGTCVLTQLMDRSPEHPFLAHLRVYMPPDAHVHTESNTCAQAMDAMRVAGAAWCGTHARVHDDSHAIVHMPSLTRIMTIIYTSSHVHTSAAVTALTAAWPTAFRDALAAVCTESSDVDAYVPLMGTSAASNHTQGDVDASRNVLLKFQVISAECGFHIAAHGTYTIPDALQGEVVAVAQALCACERVLEAACDEARAHSRTQVELEAATSYLRALAAQPHMVGFTHAYTAPVPAKEQDAATVAEIAVAEATLASELASLATEAAAARASSGRRSSSSKTNHVQLDPAPAGGGRRSAAADVTRPVSTLLRSPSPVLPAPPHTLAALMRGAFSPANALKRAIAPAPRMQSRHDDTTGSRTGANVTLRV